MFTHNKQSVAVSTTADSTHAGFTNVTGGSEDFHIKSTSPLKDAGADLIATNPYDIDGAVTGARNDIGADEYVVAAPAGSWLTGNYWWDSQ